MRIQRFVPIWLGIIAAIALIDAPEAMAGVILITPEEAKLPLPKQLAQSRAITRAPRIELLKPAEEKVQSPLHFKLRFRAFGGATIDMRTLAVTYLRGANVDLTSRISSFAQPTGVDIPNAEVPPGEHAIQIDIKDSDGRATSATFVLTVSSN